MCGTDLRRSPQYREGETGEGAAQWSAIRGREAAQKKQEEEGRTDKWWCGPGWDGS